MYRVPAVAVALLAVLAAPAFAQSSPPYLVQTASAGSGNGQLNSPDFGACDAAGIVYVCDTGNNSVQKFGPSGAYLLQWGGAGSATGKFSSPRGVAVDTAGYVYVVDSGNSRVQKFGPTGTAARSPRGCVSQDSTA